MLIFPMDPDLYPYLIGFVHDRHFNAMAFSTYGAVPHDFRAAGPMYQVESIRDAP